MWKWDEMSEAEQWCYGVPVLFVVCVAGTAAVAATVAVPVWAGYLLAEEPGYQKAITAAVIVAELCLPPLIAGVCLTIRRRRKKK